MAIFDPIFSTYSRILQNLVLLDPNNLYFPETLSSLLESYYAIVILYSHHKELIIFTDSETQMLVAPAETLSYQKNIRYESNWIELVEYEEYKKSWVESENELWVELNWVGLKTLIRNELKNWGELIPGE